MRTGSVPVRFGAETAEIDSPAASCRRGSLVTVSGGHACLQAANEPLGGVPAFR